MDDHFQKNALSWGKQGAEWLDSIPAIIKKYEQKWVFKAQKPFSLNYNYVAPVILENGSVAVIKIGFPGDREFKTETAALEEFDGKGACKLLKANKLDSIILIEKMIPGIPLSTIENDEEATKLLAAVIKKINKPLPSNHSFITPQEWVMAIPNYRAKYEDTSKPLPSAMIDKAELLFQHLIETSEEPVLLHGDLHHDNILLSSERGWVAIDPKGVAAEPAYEVAAMIRNPYEKLKHITNLEPLLIKRIEILAGEFELSPQRIYEWCFAQTMLSAVWSVDSPKSPEHALRVAQSLDKVSDYFL